jgi:hypothetical protein
LPAASAPALPLPARRRRSAGRCDRHKLAEGVNVQRFCDETVGQDASRPRRRGSNPGSARRCRRSGATPPALSGFTSVHWVAFHALSASDASAPVRGCARPLRRPAIASRLRPP